MAHRPQLEIQAASVASYAICSDRRVRIRPQRRTTRRGSSHPGRRPSLRHPSLNIPRWQRRAPIRPNRDRSRRILKPQLVARLSHPQNRRAPNRRARPAARHLPCSVAPRRPFPSAASRAASALRVKPSRQSRGLTSRVCHNGGGMSTRSGIVTLMLVLVPGLMREPATSTSRNSKGLVQQGRAGEVPLGRYRAKMRGSVLMSAQA
jgi:hypothetical protein